MRTIHRELVDDSTEKLWRVRSLKGGEERKNVVVVVVVGLFNCRKYLLVVVMKSTWMIQVGKREKIDLAHVGVVCRIPTDKSRSRILS
jgi:hypothetical protein